MSALPASITALIGKYACGSDVLRAALNGFPPDELALPTPPGAWSALAVTCHLADFELVYADRMKAILAENGPQLPGRDENRYAARLHYEQRNLSDELSLIELVRRQMTPLLRSLDAADFQRVGIHSIDGPLSLEALLTRIAGHIPHHADFIERKKQLLLKPA